MLPTMTSVRHPAALRSLVRRTSRSLLFIHFQGILGQSQVRSRQVILLSLTQTQVEEICDARGRAVSQLQVAATSAGYEQMLAWVRSAAGDRQVVWAVEGTRHYGLGLARHLASAGEQVSEIDCSRHAGKRRAGKSDPIDAVRAARELLARPHPAQMRADGDHEALRPLMTGRDNAVQSAKTARTALAAVLVTAPAPLRERLRPLPGSGGPANAPR